VTRFYDIPSGELNRAPRAGLHFGFPYDHAALPDPLLCGQAPVVTPPEHQFAAHTARYTRRPVDLLVLPDGSVLVSDDRGGVIYRISYRMP
jgi:glucose/arabinose dehydrogenase